MTDATKTAILNTVNDLFFAGRIHDTCTTDGIQLDCVGCPFRSHYIDHPTDEWADGAYYQGLCERERLWWGCAKWEDDMGDDL